ncbi:MAG TPA: hypothetical protein VGE15_05210, partial [Sphingobacteriaceae bacterium]
YYDTSIPPFGATVEATLDPYSLLDAYIQYKPASRVTLFADVKNLLDQEYTEFTGYNTRGFNFNAGFKIEFRK